jgi:hypothetical protein
MATQEGIFPLKGTIGNVTFIKTSDGKFLAQRKTSMTKERLMTDSAFKRTRENISEFGRAGKAGQTLRTAIRLLLQNIKDKTMGRRLMREMMKVIKADATSARGLRNVVDGEAELLKEFDFNENASLKKTLYKAFTASIDRATGVLEVEVPSLIPLTHIKAPEGSTHYKLVSGGYAINFENETYTGTESETAILAIDNAADAAVTLTNNVPVNSTHPLFLLLGIQFYQVVNGEYYPLLNGAFNALQIVEVNGV